MNLFHALILGVVQGLTEFVPVSSTAHLLIATHWLGLPSNDRTFAFNVIIQMGTVMAMLAFFWNEIWQITRAFILGIYHKRPFENLDARLGWLVIVATIPALVAGLLLKKFVENLFTDPLLWSGIRLMFTALLLAAVEYFDKKKRTLEAATWVDALMVGFFQVLAIFPGASRSGSTMAGAMFRGFDRPSAARFAFLMSAPILLAAGAYETIQAIMLPDTTEFFPILLVGFITSALVGWVAIRWLMAYLRQHSLYIFAAYCLIVGILVLILN